MIQRCWRAGHAEDGARADDDAELDATPTLLPCV